MENTNQTFKRQYQEQSPETRQKISNAMKNRSKTDAHRQSISNGLKSYWDGVPSRPEEEEGGFDTCM